MKTSYRTIEELNKDTTLDDVKILWTGQFVQLYFDDRFLTSIRVCTNLVAKIERWCDKNSYRCSQIVGNTIKL